MRYLVFFIMLLYLFSCSGGGGGDGGVGEKITSDDPVFLAGLAYEIASSKGDDDELVSIFRKYGYSLLEGSKAFNKAYEEVISDKDKNAIYQQKLFEYMEASLGLGKGVDRGVDRGGGVEGGGSSK